MTPVEQIERVVAVLTKHYGSPHHEDTADELYTEVIRPLVEREAALRKALEAMLTASQPQHSLKHVFLGEAQELARTTLSQEPQGPPKTLASAGRCHCGFWPCSQHQIDDISSEPSQ